MNKKVMLVLLIISQMITLFGTPAVAENTEQVTVTVDGKQVQFDAQPYIEDNRVLVPFRAIAEALGVEVR